MHPTTGMFAGASLAPREEERRSGPVSCPAPCKDASRLRPRNRTASCFARFGRQASTPGTISRRFPTKAKDSNGTGEPGQNRPRTVAVRAIPRCPITPKTFTSTNAGFFSLRFKNFVQVVCPKNKDGLHPLVTRSVSRPCNSTTHAPEMSAKDRRLHASCVMRHAPSGTRPPRPTSGGPEARSLQTPRTMRPPRRPWARARTRTPVRTEDDKRTTKGTTKKTKF